MSTSDSDAERQRRYADDLQLDEAKLTAAATSEQGEVFLLQWLAKVETALTKADVSTLLAQQRELEKTLLRIVSPSSSAAGESDGTSSPSPLPSSSSKGRTPAAQMPKPGRPARQLIARCLILLLQRAESRSLFETSHSLLRIAGEEPTKIKPNVAEKEAKVAALYILGEIFAVQGQNVMSLFLEITALTQKLFRSSASPVILRYHALTCLQKALLVGAKSLNDQPAKEIVKNLRLGLADKAGAIVRGCTECILSLADQTDYLASRSEIEAVISPAFKALETADYVTKRSLSRLCAGLLASTQAENSAPPPPTSAKRSAKKKKEGADGADSEEEEAAAQQAASAAAGGASRTLFSPAEVLDQIAQPFQRSSSSKRTRVALLDVYATLMTTLGITWTQANYALIARHLIDELPNHFRSTANRAEVLSLRTGIQLILRRIIGERMLGEPAQVLAVQEICESFIKRWPVVMPGQPAPPSKYTLVMALNEVAGLLSQLGTAPPQILDALYEPLLRCLGHPSHSVQISAAWCLRVLCTINPNQLPTTVAALIDTVKKDLVSLDTAGERGGAELTRRAVGHARGLAALVAIIPSRPLYTSFDVSSQVLTLAVELLKNCGNHSLPISGVEIQVAWTLLGALMSLGPNFVRSHLPQLLLLWRNALPKPTAKDTTPGPSTRSDAEWAFLLHVRENTLGCILAFLNHNSRSLLTLDTARRIVALLSNTLAFVDGFSSQHPHLAQEEIPGAERSSLTLLDREHMLRRRLFQCFSSLSTNTAMEPLQDALIPVALQAFAEPDRYVGTAAQAAIAASAGTFTTLWAMQDGYGFGVTSLQRDEETFIAEASGSERYRSTSATTRPDLLNRDSIEAQIDALQRRPVLGAAEHDPLVLFARYDENSRSQPPLPPPPATAMVDAALELFAILLPFQARDVQISAFETMLAYSRSSKLDRNPGRRAAIQINACVATLGALRVAMQGGIGIAGKRPAGFNNDRLTTALREVLKDALLHGDAVLRSVSSQTYGRLAAVAGSHAMSSQVQFLVDQVVSNRDPDARAGCALAFGAIYSEVGGLSAGPLTKTIVNVLMSLSSDPHPTVHYSALEALRYVIEAASLSYSAYVTSTLGMLVKLYMLDTHEPEGGSAGSVNLRAELPAHQAICRVISALIGVLGPDLQEPSKVTALIHALLREFSKEKDDGAVVEATKATQHFCLFAADQLDVEAYIGQLTDHLRSRKRPRKLAAIHGFYQLVQRQALLVSKVGGDALVADLFAQLDLEPSMDGVREVLLSWLRQTADLSPGSWIDLCQRIMSRVAKGPKPAATTAAAPPPGMLQDEEAAAIDLGDGGAGNDAAALQGSRWRTQLFALQCLHEVFAVVRRSGRLEHFAAPPPNLSPQQTRALMSSRVTDLIRMAFTASTAANAEIRLEGLVVLQDVIECFKLARDPDFEEALLLEQHQAPIAAALTPAFLADSTPEVLAAAVRVCAVFVGSGVVREVDRMGRILKQLVAALTSCMDPEMQSLGDVKDLSPNAAAMLKVAVFTAWSELEVASVTQEYLVQVVRPHLPSLAPYWIGSLREYAKIKIDPDSSAGGMGMDFMSGSAGAVVVNPSLDSQYAGLARDVLYPHYQQSWFKMLQAISVLMKQNDPIVAQAMDGEVVSATSPPPTPSAFRSEPTIFFFVLYGLAFESLASHVGSTSSNAIEAARQVRIMQAALDSMCCLANPVYAGTALLQEGQFAELCNLCYRIVMTESMKIQLKVVELIVALTTGYKERLLDGDGTPTSAVSPAGPSTLPSSAKLTQLLRIIVSVITRSRLQPGLADDKVVLVRAAFSAYFTVADTFGPTLQEDLMSIALYLYSDMLRDEHVEVDLVSPTLSTLKDICERSTATMRPSSDVVPRALHGFLSSALNAMDETRGRAGQIVINKTKNCLMTTTIVLTSLSASVKLSQAALEHACYHITSKMAAVHTSDEEQQQVAMTAAQCGRSLLLSSGKGSPALQYCVGQLLPSMVEYAANVGSQGKLTTASLGVTAEAFKAFEGLCSVLPDSHRGRLLTVLLPTLILSLDPNAQPAVPPLHTLAVQTLLSLASHHPVAFKEATGRIGGAERETLETSIRNAVEAARGGGAGRAGGGSAADGPPRSAGASGSGTPGASIALKSFG
ncbi:ARM repeat-containing protein [Microstroma glucosiphilum]|uniref:ARM repeat-containing protein n=1 Tax=Pseudomicrostroma glucosiphilum TaxID=1684307 RepID=A0A316TZM3_9BASI|nr:ARM repeat-containing protein [Pseudomicrostroma glucosiphilum]PWN18626.1 ARM repeat-containing protein [Pseudomicrostroma glucosiphilum]